MKEKKTPKIVIIEDVGYICLDFFRGEDIWGKWHEETNYCYAETKDGGIDLASSIGEAIGDCAPACAMAACGTECSEEEREECSNRDNRGICKPKLIKFRITIETEPLTDQAKIENWWLTKNPVDKAMGGSRNFETISHEPLPWKLFEDRRESLSHELGISQDALQYIRDLIEACQGKHIHWNKNSAQIVASCIYIVASYKQSAIKKSQISDAMNISAETVEAYCDEICSSLSLPPISPKQLTEKQAKFEEELKQHALELRRLINQGKSFFYISDYLKIEPRKLKQFLKRLKLKPAKTGWTE